MKNTMRWMKKTARVCFAILCLSAAIARPIPAVYARAETLQATVFTTCAAQTQIPVAECEALLALYNGTNGASWTYRTGWLESDMPCSWHGIACTNGNRVTQLSLPSNNLNGPIPAALGNLTELTFLDLSYNSLTGPVPPQLGNLSRLNILVLEHNQLSGSISSPLYNLANLSYLYLNDNQLSGPIPPGLANLQALIGLNLKNNQLSGSVPTELGTMPNLVDVALNNNALTGFIPAQLGNLTKLQYLRLSDNELTGSIPIQLGNLADLAYLELRQNQLSGPIPRELGRLTNLRWLDLSVNRLTGSIPRELGALKKLQNLNLAMNLLSGGIPAELGGLPQMSELYLTGNHLSGNIPASLGNLPELRILYLQGNQLSGPIPPQLGDLPNLYALNLAHNQLTGTIPAHLGDAPQLSYLDLNINQLTGSIPVLQADLYSLALDHNYLSGEIPPQIGEMRHLEYLSLNDNELTGNLPAEMGWLTQLQFLYLQNNRLAGEIPSSMIYLSKLRSLMLSCGLTSSDPALIAFLEGIEPGWQNSICPVVQSIRRGSSDPNDSNFLIYHVTFSQDVTSVDPHDFAVAMAGGVMGAAVAIVDGSGSAWTVIVSTGAGTGTLRLDVTDNDSILNGAGIPLGGEGLGNGDSTSGESYHMIPNTDILIGGGSRGGLRVGPTWSTRQSFAGVNNGPVQIIHNNGMPMLAAERVIYKVNGVNTSFSEMMAIPEGQLDTTYWLPWYNNVDLDTQLRFANTSTTSTAVHVFVGNTEVSGSPFNLAAGASTRRSLPSINNGPVNIVSHEKIAVSTRMIYKVNGVNTSFSELMALPSHQLDTTYWLPWYNNVDLDTQLRIANVSDADATVHISIGGQEVEQSPLSIAAGTSTRLRLTGVNGGPVKIESDQLIVAAERVIYKVNGLNTSFSEMMAVPGNQLGSSYYFPWYNNRDLDTQLRIASASEDAIATVAVYIAGVEMPGSPFALYPGESVRMSFPGVNNGPVQVFGDRSIVAAERVIYKVNGVNTSFSEMIGLTDTEVNTLFWLPWYNNVDLDTQLRIGTR